MAASSTTATIAQVFEADGDRVVYRAELKGCGNALPDPADFALTAKNGTSLTAHAEFFILEPQAKGANPVLSIKADGSAANFTLTYQGRALDTMTGRRRERMRIRRDLDMVNPSIDGAYAGYPKPQPLPAGSIPAGFHPLVSIICPLYNTPLPYLRDMIDSVVTQTYDNWELVLVNASPNNQGMQEVLSTYTDERIKTIDFPKNLGIAGNTNIGIKQATGDYIAFADHDDTLSPYVLERYMAFAAAHPDADLFYCDEDNFEEDDSAGYAPRFKPDFNRDLLYSHNYMVHMLMVSRYVLDRVELSPDEVSGAQDYDLSLKAVEHARRICHIPEVLYHWRVHAGSTNGGVMESKPYAVLAGATALENHFSRRGIETHVEETSNSCVYHVDYKNASPAPKIGLAVMSNSTQDTACLLESINSAHGISSTSIILDPTSLKAAAREALETLDTELVLFATDKIELDDESCIATTASYFCRAEVGIVSPKLFYPDGLIAQAGTVLLADGTPVAPNRNFTDNMGGGYNGLAEATCNFSAASPDLFMIRHSDLEAVIDRLHEYGNLQTEVMELSFLLRQQDKLILGTPHARATTHGSGYVAAANLNAIHGSATGLTELLQRFPTMRKDVLANPNVEYTSGYPRLDIERDENAEAKRIYTRGVLSSIKHRILG
ncbi:glycosyltransferase family 2 protein [Collinsella bouchesdurhonensis]|uniref:glycosyltransferase family 2 protein n=1 Tax=Collinsella bouchesdurhonensis TaxID=1907654 RepID=UPI003F89893C